MHGSGPGLGPRVDRQTVSTHRGPENVLVSTPGIFYGFFRGQATSSRLCAASLLWLECDHPAWTFVKRLPASSLPASLIRILRLFSKLSPLCASFMIFLTNRRAARRQASSKCSGSLEIRRKPCFYFPTVQADE